jgi:hypothetical protein
MEATPRYRLVRYSAHAVQLLVSSRNLGRPYFLEVLEVLSTCVFCLVAREGTYTAHSTYRVEYPHGFRSFVVT